MENSESSGPNAGSICHLSNFVVRRFVMELERDSSRMLGTGTPNHSEQVPARCKLSCQTAIYFTSSQCCVARFKLCFKYGGDKEGIESILHCVAAHMLSRTSVKLVQSGLVLITLVGGRQNKQDKGGC